MLNNNELAKLLPKVYLMSFVTSLFCMVAKQLLVDELLLLCFVTNLFNTEQNYT